jgi:hypothetical protein
MGQCEETGTKPLQIRNICPHRRNHLVVELRCNALRLEKCVAPGVERRPKIKDSSKYRPGLARGLVLLLVGAAALVACTHIQVSLDKTAPDLKATETAIAESVVATLTGQAPSPTLTPVATARPVATPMPTATPLPAATPTETPTTAPTVTSTATPKETSTSTPTKTPTPIPPLTPSPIPCRLSLVSPPDGASFDNETSVVTLQWQFDRALAPNEYFFVSVTYPHRGQTWYDGTWVDPARQIPSGTRDTSWELEDYLCAEDLSDTGCFDWNVAMKRRKGGYPDLSDEVECLSPTWSFCWTGCEKQPTSTPLEPTPTPVPPTETPPPTVYPPLPTETHTPPPYPPLPTETPTEAPTATTVATWTPTTVATGTATAQR